MSADTLDYIRLAQEGDEEVIQTLIEENAPLIWSVVRRFYGRGCESDDLFQLGSIGFIKAVRGFDLAFGTQFSTYAVPKIAGEIKRFLRDDGMIKVSRGIKENAHKVAAAKAEFESRQGRSPHLSELSEMTGLDSAEIASCENVPGSTLSLEGETQEDGPSLMQFLGSDGHEESVVERLSLHEALDTLSPQERAILSLRFFREFTQQRTAQVLGISQVQVSRLERRAFEKLRHILE